MLQPTTGAIEPDLMGSKMAKQKESGISARETTKYNSDSSISFSSVSPLSSDGDEHDYDDDDDDEEEEEDEDDKDVYQSTNMALGEIVISRNDTLEAIVTLNDNFQDCGDGVVLGVGKRITMRRIENNNNNNAENIINTSECANADSVTAAMTTTTTTNQDGGCKLAKRKKVTMKSVYGGTGNVGMFRNCFPKCACGGEKNPKKSKYKTCAMQRWSYVIGFLSFSLFGMVGAAFVRFTVYLATGSDEYDIGKIVVSDIPCVGDLVMACIVAVVGGMLFLVSKYLFKRWAARLLLDVVGTQLAMNAMNDNSDNEEEYEDYEASEEYTEETEEQI